MSDADQTSDHGQSVWDISKGRNAFMGRHSQMPQKNFWWYVMRAHNEHAALGDPVNAPLWEWKPQQANCPELDSEVCALAGVCPPDWQPLLRSIFVGRTYDGDLNAEARRVDNSAWVSISLQCTSAIGAYIAAFDRLNSLAASGASPGTEPEILGVFENISISRAGWADASQYVGTHSTLMGGPNGRTAEFYSPRVTDAEMFAICHEYAHHLLGHTSKSQERLRVADSLLPVLRLAGLEEFVHNRPERQTGELLADALGLYLGSLPRNDRGTEVLYSAMVGSIAVLLAEADVKNHWLLDEPDGHPATLDRVALLLAVMPHLLEARPIGEQDSVIGLRNQLAMFASACLQASLHSRDPRDYPAPTWEQLISAARTGSLALRSSLETANAMLSRRHGTHLVAVLAPTE